MAMALVSVLKSIFSPITLGAFAVFSFQIISAPMISTIMAGQHLYLGIACPLLALGLAGICSHFLKRRSNILPLLNIFTHLSIPVSLLSLHLLQNEIDKYIA